MFGGFGESKLIVSVSFGADATFRWARNSDRDGSSGWSQRLSHGDVLFMDGKAQDQFEHWTEAGAQGERVNLTYRWIGRHNPGCVSTAGVLCCLPSLCGRFIRSQDPWGLWVLFFPLLCLVIALFVVVAGCVWLSGPSLCPSSSGARGSGCRRACRVGETVWYHLPRSRLGTDWIKPKEKPRFGGLQVAFFSEVAWHSAMCPTSL